MCDKEFSKRGSLTSHIKLHSANLLEVNNPVSTVIVSESNSLEAEDPLHSSSISTGGMKVEVNLEDIKVDVDNLNSNSSDAGVMSTLEVVHPSAVVATTLLNDPHM